MDSLTYPRQLLKFCIQCNCGFSLLYEILISFFLYFWCYCCSVAKSHPTLRPRGLQHARLPCSPLSPMFTHTHVHRLGGAIQAPHPLLSRSPPVLNQHEGLFQWVLNSKISTCWKVYLLGYSPGNFLLHGLFFLRL